MILYQTDFWMKIAARILHISHNFGSDRSEAEKEEAQKKANAERDADLLAIMNSVKAFNEKYEENVLLLTQKDTRNLTLNDLFFPWL